MYLCQRGAAIKQILYWLRFVGVGVRTAPAYHRQFWEIKLLDFVVIGKSPVGIAVAIAVNTGQVGKRDGCQFIAAAERIIEMPVVSRVSS